MVMLFCGSSLVLAALSLFDEEYQIAMSINNTDFYWIRDLMSDVENVTEI